MSIFDGKPEKVSVAIISHNYGRYLDEALSSVLLQSRPADEIVVVDDASDEGDQAKKIARKFEQKHQNIRYVRIEERSAWKARQAGLHSTTGDVVCFLDADDQLGNDYLEAGLKLLAEDYRNGVVYTDLQHRGDCHEKRVFPDDHGPHEIDRVNWIHSGSLVRRIALEVSRAFEGQVPSRDAHEDWILWQRVLGAGWRAVKSPATYFYRQHAASKTKQAGSMDDKYKASTAESAEVTIVTALSGRAWAWPKYARWLVDQYVNGFAKLRLLLIDTSHSVEFRSFVHKDIEVLYSCFNDFRYVRMPVGDPGLADALRAINAHPVRMACAKLYNWVAREVNTPWILTVEDDILPPVDVIPRLLECATIRTMAIACPYRSRFYDGYVQSQIDATTLELLPIRERQTGVQPASSLGFGCTLFRHQMLAESVMTAGGNVLPDFDTAFFARWKGWERLVNWNIEAEHRTAPNA